MAPKVVRFRVVPNEEGTMLGSLVGKRMPGLDAEQGRALVKAGGVYMGHLRVRVPSTRVVAGERISVYPEALEHEELDLSTVRFVLRRQDFVIIDKPAGVPVAATKSSARGTLSEALRRILVGEGMTRPYVGTVHRLDQGASGLILFTIRSIANKSVHALFQKHEIQRTYRVRVQGEVPQTMVCEASLEPIPGSDSVRVAKPNSTRAKSAKTSFRRLEPERELPGTSLVEVELETGRTHQIRVHAAELGFPVVGDLRYGNDDAPAEGEHPRLHLHAWRLRFDNPLHDEAVDVEADLPDWARAN